MISPPFNCVCRSASTTERCARRLGRKDTRQVRPERATYNHVRALTTFVTINNPVLDVALKKDPGIPNLYPFKEHLMKQLEEKKQRAEEDKERRKLERQKEHARKRSLQGLQNDAERRTKEFDKKVCNPTPNSPRICTGICVCVYTPPLCACSTSAFTLVALYTCVHTHVYSTRDTQTYTRSCTLLRDTACLNACLNRLWRIVGYPRLNTNASLYINRKSSAGSKRTVALLCPLGS